MFEDVSVAAIYGAAAIAQHRTLVLNQNDKLFSYPLLTLNAEDTMQAYCLDRFEVVSWSLTYMRSARREYRLPSVVRLRQSIEPKRLMATPMLTLEHLFIRDQGLCQYTGQPLRMNTRCPTVSATIDHVMPRGFGGLNAWENVVLCSYWLNNQKGCHTPEDVGLKLRQQPWVPTGADLLQRWLTLKRLEHLPSDWQEFLRPENIDVALAA